MIPDEFDGMILVNLDVQGARYMETDEDPGNAPFTVFFYRREHEAENSTLGQFVETIPKRNMGWDKPSRQLFYRGMSGKLYTVSFEEVK